LGRFLSFCYFPGGPCGAQVQRRALLGFAGKCVQICCGTAWTQACRLAGRAMRRVVRYAVCLTCSDLHWVRSGGIVCLDAPSLPPRSSRFFDGLPSQLRGWFLALGSRAADRGVPQHVIYQQRLVSCFGLPRRRPGGAATRNLSAEAGFPNPPISEDRPSVQCGKRQKCFKK